MIEEKYKLLINRYLDNEISSEEKKYLDEFLGSNEEGSKYFNEIIKISSYLNKDEEVIPSQNIKKNILNSIDHSKYIKPVKTSYLEKVSRILHKLDRKVVLSFCSGAAVVLLFFIMFESPNFENENTTNISGTLVHNNNSSTLESNEYILNDAHVAGNIYESTTDDIISIDFELVSDEVNQIHVDFDIDYLKFLQITNKSNQNFKFDLKSGIVLIEASGKSDFSLAFSKNDDIIPINSLSLTINEEKLKKK